MRCSHTLSLINEAFEKIQEFNYKKYISELENISQKWIGEAFGGRSPFRISFLDGDRMYLLISQMRKVVS
ncbi:hypothetical protein [Caldisericum sp.]|jgi:hypothetical protein|uniref:hypothetical protein n=1 Tax=Caldisericum sp. TaxID=2499687 RepID=UPI003D1094B0